jgi:hypothetical protein
MASGERGLGLVEVVVGGEPSALSHVEPAEDPVAARNVILPEISLADLTVVNGQIAGPVDLAGSEEIFGEPTTRTAVEAVTLPSGAVFDGDGPRRMTWRRFPCHHGGWH